MGRYSLNDVTTSNHLHPYFFYVTNENYRVCVSSLYPSCILSRHCILTVPLNITAHRPDGFTLLFDGFE